MSKGIYIQGKDGLVPVSLDANSDLSSTKEELSKEIDKVESNLVTHAQDTNLHFTEQEKTKLQNSLDPEAITEDETGTLSFTDEDGNIITKIDDEGVHTLGIEVGNLGITSTEDNFTIFDNEDRKALEVDSTGITTVAALKIQDTDVAEQLTANASNIIAVGSNLKAHAENTDIHITTDEREHWNNKDFSTITNNPIEEVEEGLIIADDDGNKIFSITESGLDTIQEVTIHQKDTKIKVSESLGALQSSLVTLENQIGNLSNVMNFRGVFENFNQVSNPADGDVIIISAAAEGITADSEWVYFDGSWEEIGNASPLAQEVGALTGRVGVLEGRAEDIEDSIEQTNSSITNLRNELTTDFTSDSDNFIIADEEGNYGLILEETEDGVATLSVNKLSTNTLSLGTTDVKTELNKIRNAGNGLVDDGSAINIKIDNSGDPYLKVSENGLKLEGIGSELSALGTRIDNTNTRIDNITAGDGLKREDDTFSVKLAANGNEEFLTVDSNGLKLSGIQNAIDAKGNVLNDALTEAKKELASAISSTETSLRNYTDDAKEDSIKHTDTIKEELITQISDLKEELTTEIISNTEEFVIVDKDDYINTRINSEGIETTAIKITSIEEIEGEPTKVSFDVKNRFAQVESTIAATDSQVNTALRNHIEEKNNDDKLHISNEERNNWNNKVDADYVAHEIANLVDSSPDTLNTLNELAQALGDDPNFATTVASELSSKATKEELKQVKEYTDDELINLKSELTTEIVSESDSWTVVDENDYINTRVGENGLETAAVKTTAVEIYNKDDPTERFDVKTRFEEVESAINGLTIDEKTFILADDLYTYVPIGNAQRASNEVIGTGDIISVTNRGKIGKQGDTLKIVFNNIFGEETDVEPTVTNNSILTVNQGTTSYGGGEYGTNVSATTVNITFTLENSGTANYGYRCGATKTTGSQTFKYAITKQSEADLVITLPSDKTAIVTEGTQVSSSNNKLYCNFSNNKVTIQISLVEDTVDTTSRTRYGQITAVVKLGEAQTNGGTKIDAFLTYLKDDGKDKTKLSGGDISSTAGPYTISAGYKYVYWAKTNDTTQPTSWTRYGNGQTSVTDLVLSCSAGQYLWVASTGSYNYLYQFNEVSGTYNTEPVATTKTTNITINNSQGVSASDYNLYRTTNPRSLATNTKFKLA